MLTSPTLTPLFYKLLYVGTTITVLFSVIFMDFFRTSFSIAVGFVCLSCFVLPSESIIKDIIPDLHCISSNHW